MTKTSFDTGLVAHWAFAIQASLQKEVEARFPSEAHRWPLLRAMDAEARVWRGTHLILIMKDKLSGIPAFGQGDDIKESDGPPDEPSADNIQEWIAYVRKSAGLRAQDAVVIVPMPANAKASVQDQFAGWSAAEMDIWGRQLDLTLTTQFYWLKGLDMTGEFFIPPGYQFLAEDCKRLLDDHPDYEKNVFIMTRLQPENRLLQSLDSELRHVLADNGYDPMRADDKMYLRDRNLWNNVCLYMVCCRQGVAILEDRIEDEFNPNVALEYGFMRGLNKPALLLKDVGFRKLRADIMGTLWEEFDITDIEGTIREPVEKWLAEL